MSERGEEMNRYVFILPARLRAAAAHLEAAGQLDLADYLRERAAATRPEADEAAFIAAAAEKYGRDGEIEVDDNAVVSHGDRGAYVMGWLYIYNNEAGLASDDPNGL
jgi:hypothetical protein